jgi:hypothetical protein
LLLVLSFFVASCGGVADLLVGPVAVTYGDAVGQRCAGSVTVYEAYDKADLKEAGTRDILLNDVKNLRKKLVSCGAGKVVVSGFMRAAIFWVIPPVGTAFANTGNYFLIRYRDGQVYGIAVDGKTIKYLKADADGKLKNSPEAALPFRVTQAGSKDIELTLTDAGAP